MIVAHTYAIWPNRTGFELHCPLGLVIIIMRVVIIINRDYFMRIYATLLMKRHYIIIQMLHWTPLPVTVSLWSCSWPRTCRSRSGTAVGLGHKKLLGTSWVISWTLSCIPAWNLYTKVIVSDWRIEGDDHLYLLAEDTLVLSSEAVVTVVNPLQPADDAVDVKGN